MTGHSTAQAPHLEELTLSDLTKRLADGQTVAVSAIQSALPALNEAIEAALIQLENSKSRLVYCGAGTSGRLAVLDATELFPTFNWPKARTKYLLAGGVKAIRESAEDAEDNADAARQDAQKISLCKDDIVVALAASGTTPYTLEVVMAGNEAGALTIGFANKSPSPLLTLPAKAVFLDTGEEVLPGSSRLAAGTAQKMALNIFSTAIMVKLGKVYKGRMVDMRASNIKLRRRAIDMVMELAACSEAVAKDALAQHNNRVKPAILSLIS